MKKVIAVILFASIGYISSAQAGFIVEVEGETPANITPKLTVNKLASYDVAQASDGVPDLFTPLHLSGTISFGYKGGQMNSANIQAADSMYAILGRFKYPGVGNDGGLPALNVANSPLIVSTPNTDINFMLARTVINGACLWGLSMQAQKSGQALFLDTSSLTGLNSNVVFTQMPQNTSIPKVITANIFPQSSGKTEHDLMAQFTIEGNPQPFQSLTNSFTVGDNALTFLFRRASAS